MDRNKWHPRSPCHPQDHFAGFYENMAAMRNNKVGYDCSKSKMTGNLFFDMASRLGVVNNTKF